MADNADHDVASADPATQASPETGAAQCSRYADIAVELGYCSRERIDAVLRPFCEAGEDPNNFGAVLVEEGVVTKEQSRACERALRGRSSIGGFAILEKVGQGGMGTVFRARQISMDRIVAVKILAPKFAQDPDFKKRFLNEARTCAKLSHLNIINGIDCGEDSGYTYFAMEFVEGQTVKQVMKSRKQLEPDEAYNIIRQITVALSYARKFDMVHRDIKPDNIMITPTGVAKLCDLGLAMEAENSENRVEAVPTEAEKKDSKTSGKKEASRLALGTPHYMSPEQARGEKNIDARSDIYSLGATFYHMIIGETVFVGKTSTEVMMHHVIDSAPNPCEIDPELPPALGMIISKMMAKSPADRYSDADALLADLDAAKNGTIPEAAGFNAKSSCLILPEEALRRLRSGGTPGWKRMLPHAAAALVLGVLAYFAIVNLGSKTTVVTTEPVKATVPGMSSSTPHVAIATTVQTPATIKTETIHKIPDVKPEVKVAVTGTPDKKIPDKEKKPEPASVAVATATKTIQAPPDVPSPPPAPPPVIPELPRPEFKPTREILYAHFLHEYDMRAGKMETGKLYSEMHDLALSATYDPAREDIKAELADLKAGWEFEIKILKKIAEQKTDIDLSPEMAHKWDQNKAKAINFAESRGVQIELKIGLVIYIAASTVPIETIFSKATDATPLSKAQFLYARGNRQSIFVLKPPLPATEMPRWDRKIELLAVKEAELKAREEYKNLTTIAEAKSWKTFSDMVVDFQRDYATTQTFKTNAAQIRQWQEAALHALEPPSKWRSVFHAATVEDVPGNKGETMVELVYDFKTPEQVHDFSCTHGALKVENGQLVVPPGGGEFSHIRFIAPFASIQSLIVTGKTLQKDLPPMGIVFVDALKTVEGPGAENPMIKFDPETKTAGLWNLKEGPPPSTDAPPEFDWHKNVTFGFKTVKGSKIWMVDDKPVAEGRIPKQFAGGWITLWSAEGNQSWSSVHIVFKPDEDWEKMKVKKKAETSN